MRCPNCGLFNPESAQRCDCGYDFDKGTMEKPYYIEKPREDSKASKILTAVYFIILLFIHFIFFPIVLGMGLITFINALPLTVILSIVTYYGFFCFLYLQLRKGKNWARITLAIITFPYGAFLFNSEKVKSYCLQREWLEKKR